MDSIGEECKELKKKYDECFNEWFGEYLKGKTTDTCHVLFKEYRNCVHKVLETKGIDVNEAYAKVLGTSAEKTVPEKESAAMKKSDSKSKWDLDSIVHTLSDRLKESVPIMTLAGAVWSYKKG